MRNTLFALTLLSPAVLAQGVPTFNDVNIGNAPLDAGGTVPVLMDIRIPVGVTAPVACVLWIHGGGWQNGDHNAIPASAQPLLTSGIAVATIDYRLSGQAVFPAQIEDVKGAVRYLRANAVTLGIDPLRIGCWGSSAGGHLSALLATSGGVAACEGTTGGNLSESSAVLVAADYFGPTDLLQINADITTPPGGFDHDDPSSPESHLLGFDGVGEGLAVLRANLSNPNPPFPALAALAELVNPITHVDASDPPTFVSHGTADSTVPFHQSERIVAALQAVSVEVEWIPAVGFGHGNLGSAVDAAARAFLVLHLSDCNANGLLDDADVANGSLDSDGDGLLDQCETSGGPAGIPVCFGDGSGLACPCGNTSAVGAQSGCRNSLGSGARLVASGTASLAADSLVLVGSQMPNASALYFQGTAALGAGGIGIPFGDGHRCAGGQVIRLRTVTNVGGASSQPSPGDLAVSVRGAIAAPGSRWYQVWYRNAAAFCTASTFNLSNAVRIDWSA